ncbi:hypothetical protein HDU99_005195, partial [Rhizoclosmatium hyalinum]
MSFKVIGSPFLPSFQDALSCDGLPDLPPLAHLCLSSITTQSEWPYSFDDLAKKYITRGLASLNGPSDICGASLTDKLNSVYSGFGAVTTFSYTILDAKPKPDAYVKAISLNYTIKTNDNKLLPCSLPFHNSAASAGLQDTDYILSAQPKCGSQFIGAPNTQIDAESSCFGALKFDGGSVSFPWCLETGKPYNRFQLATRFAALVNKMALISLGRDTLVFEFANDWKAPKLTPDTLCTLEYHSMALGKSKGTYLLSDKDTVFGALGITAKNGIDKSCISYLADDSKPGTFVLPDGDAEICGGTSFKDRFQYLFKPTVSVVASYVDLDTIIIVASSSLKLKSNVGAQIIPPTRRD